MYTIQEALVDGLGGGEKEREADLKSVIESLAMTENNGELYEVIQYPSAGRMFHRDHIPNPMIEMTGSSTAGKSTLAELMRQTTSYYVLDEFHTVVDGEIVDLRESRTLSRYRPEEEPERLRRLHLWFAKQIAFRDLSQTIQLDIHNAIDKMIKDKEIDIKPRVNWFSPVVQIRGFNDMLSLDMPLMLKRGGEVAWSTLITGLYGSDWICRHIDAVILLYLGDHGYEEAQRRRVAMGLAPKGKFVNDDDWPIHENGLKWWLNQFYPFLHKYYGTGVLSIDAMDNDVDTVYRTVLHYIETVKQMTMNSYVLGAYMHF